MPTNKIESRDEAAKAFRNGAYFKVGDQFISPDEIVTARRDGSGNPVFKLTTGETVVHSQFNKGSTGHFLFEQLRKVEGRYVEKIKPVFNRFLTIPTNQDLTVVDANGATIVDTGITADQRRFVKVNSDAKLAVVTPLNVQNSRIIDVTDWSVIATVTTAQGSDPNTPFSAISDAGRIFIAHEDFANGDLYVSEFDSTGGLVDTPVTGGTNIGNVQGIEYMEGENSLLIKGKSGSFKLLDLSSNTVSSWAGTITGSGFPDGPVQRPGTSTVYYCKDNLWSLDAGSLANDDEKKFELFNFGSRQRTIAGVTGNGKVVIANGDGESAIFDGETGEKEKTFPFAVAAAFLDLSVL